MSFKINNNWAESYLRLKQILCMEVSISIPHLKPLHPYCWGSFHFIGTWAEALWSKTAPPRVPVSGMKWNRWDLDEQNWRPAVAWLFRIDSKQKIIIWTGICSPELPFSPDIGTFMFFKKENLEVKQGLTCWLQNKALTYTVRRLCYLFVTSSWGTSCNSNGFA